MTKAPLGGEATGPNPTDRGKSGTKRSLLSDGRGQPLSVAVTGANVNDHLLLAKTLDSIPIPRPLRTTQDPHHLCLHKGYDYPRVPPILQERNYTHTVAIHPSRRIYRPSRPRRQTRSPRSSGAPPSLHR